MSKSKLHPPKNGVSPELVEIVLRWLRQTYGSRPIRMGLEFDYHLGQLERYYAGTPDDDVPFEIDKAVPEPPTARMIRRA